MMMNKFFGKYQKSLLSFGAFLAVWEISVRLGFFNALFVSTPFEILKALAELFSSGKIFPHLLASAQAFSVGFSLAVFLGILGGFLVGYSKNAYEYAKPFVFMLSALPVVAIVPLVIIWFGIGILSKISIVFLMAFIPIFINVIDGAKNFNRDYETMAQSFGLKKSRILQKVIFFDALPFVFSGARVAVGKGIIGLVISEVFGYGKGVGYLISYYGGIFETSKLMALIFLLLAVTLLLVEIIAIIEKRIIKWK